MNPSISHINANQGGRQRKINTTLHTCKNHDNFTKKKKNGPKNVWLEFGRNDKIKIMEMHTKKFKKIL